MYTLHIHFELNCIHSHCVNLYICKWNYQSKRIMHLPHLHIYIIHTTRACVSVSRTHTPSSSFRIQHVLHTLSVSECKCEMELKPRNEKQHAKMDDKRDENKKENNRCHNRPSITWNYFVMHFEAVISPTLRRKYMYPTYFIFTSSICLQLNGHCSSYFFLFALSLAFTFIRQIYTRKQLDWSCCAEGRISTKSCRTFSAKLTNRAWRNVAITKIQFKIIQADIFWQAFWFDLF